VNKAAPFADDLVALAPARAGESWCWWHVRNGVIGALEEGDLPPSVTGRATVLVPPALAPVRNHPLWEMPPAQAVTATRIAETERAFLGEKVHVAVAADEDGVLSARVATADMDIWLAACAAAGMADAALVPAALILPRPQEGTALGDLAGVPLARTSAAAFAGEDALIQAMAGPNPVTALDKRAIEARLLAVHAATPLDLRQAGYARRRVSFFALPDWRGLARMAACAALLAMVLMTVRIVKWNADAARQEAAALAMVQQRFPSAVDMDSAERIVSSELSARGARASGFSALAAALIDTMQAVPTVSLRDMGYGTGGALRFTAVAAKADDLDALVGTLRRAGWDVTAPSTPTPDQSGAAVSTITMRAP